MLLAAFLTAAQPPGAPPSAAPPDTEIFLAPFSSGATFVVGQPVNITNSPGYDNQPSFTPDGTGVLFTSNRGGGTISFVERVAASTANGGATLSIRELNPKTKAITPLVDAVTGAREADCAWTPDGMVVMAEKDLLYGWRPGQSGWRRLADLAALGLQGVTRIAISPKGDRIAFVKQGPQP